MAGSWSLHFISNGQGSVGWDPLGWPANRLSSLSCGVCESLDTASPAAGDSSSHNSYCRAHYLPPWTQREVSQLLHSFSFVCCSWECCLWRLRLDPSALHSLILPEQLRLHLTPFTPMISSFYPNHPEKGVCFAVESWAQWHPHCRGVWWQLFGYLSPLAALWGGSMDSRACNA